MVHFPQPPKDVTPKERKSVSSLGYTLTQDEESIRWNDDSDNLRQVAPFDSPSRLLDDASPKGTTKRQSENQLPNLPPVATAGVVRKRPRHTKRKAPPVATLLGQRPNDTHNHRIRPPNNTSLSMPSDGSADFDNLLQQVQTPSPASSSRHKGGSPGEDDDDEFGDLKIGLDDIAAMDSLVEATQSMRASQSEDASTSATAPTQQTVIAVNQFRPSRKHENATTAMPVVLPSVDDSRSQPRESPLRVSQSATSKQDAVVPSPQNNQDDPFGTFPEIDFDEMDKFILQQTQPSVEAALKQDLEVLQQEAIQGASPRQETDGFLAFSRYKIVNVCYEDYTATLAVASWNSEMLTWNSRQIHRSDHNGVIHRNREPAWEVVGDIHLHNQWSQVEMQPGDIIHVCSLNGTQRTDPAALPLTISSNNHGPNGEEDDLVLVLHPDILLTPTTISEAVSCDRRAALKDRLGSTGLSNKDALFGTLRHQLFEETLKQEHVSVEGAQAHIEAIVREHAESLLACGVTSREAKRELAYFVPKLTEFAERYTSLNGSHSKGIDLLNEFDQPSTRFLATSVEAVEEPAISPELGLKGNIDMIVNATSTRHRRSTNSIFGVELKTGHRQTTHQSHMAQLLLYLVMLQVRYGSSREDPSKQGLLLYMNKDAIRAIHTVPSLSHVKALLAVRNSVASAKVRVSAPRGVVEAPTQSDSGNTNIVELASVFPPTQLPDRIPDAFQCTRCFQNRDCMLYSRVNGKNARIDSSDDLLVQMTGHLEPDDLEYFSKWDRLIDLEVDAGKALVTEAWLVPAVDRERDTGKCLSQLSLDASKSHGKLVSFRRHSQASRHSPFTSLSLQKGAHAVVSVDRTTIGISEKRTSRSQMHVLRGYIKVLEGDRIDILASEHDLSRVLRLTNSSQPLLFRIDCDDVATGVGTLRQNLVNLFAAEKQETGKQVSNVLRPSRMKNLRNIVVRHQPPKTLDTNISMFSPPSNFAETLPGCDLLDLAMEFTELNRDQQNAVKMISSSEDYCVVQGLPGTGKTSIITYVTRLLAAHGKRVLITSYTHAAVDNVLLKLIDKGLVDEERSSSAVVRVGQASSCHPDVHSILVPTLAKGMEDSSVDLPPRVESLAAVVKSARIVGVSALSIPRSNLLYGEDFDVVIVDEAGQINQPAILGALSAADSFILVGDHQQLPPLVTSELAARGGFGVSLMQNIADKNPSAVSSLKLQYRMNAKICELSSRFVYGGKMECGNENVQRATLNLPGFPENVRLTSPSDMWRQRLLDPRSPLVFLDTDTSHGKGTTELERITGRGRHGSIVNDTEAQTVRAIVEDLVSCNLSANCIGVVCPFKAQLSLLQGNAYLSNLLGRGLEMSTVDRYQGRDKPVIILSFVRSNVKHKVGRLLEDIRRINVAITRAKHKLIMIGSLSTLKNGSAVLKPILEYMEQQNNIVHLPRSTNRAS